MNPETLRGLKFEYEIWEEALGVIIRLEDWFSDRSAWTKGQAYKENSNGTCRYCLSYAVTIFCPTQHRPNTWRAVQQALHVNLPETFPWRSTQLEAFNDHRSTTFEVLRQLLSEAKESVFLAMEATL
jgi:hypothetical protein